METIHTYCTALPTHDLADRPPQHRQGARTCAVCGDTGRTGDPVRIDPDTRLPMHDLCMWGGR